jgi:hypothetical protein
MNGVSVGTRRWLRAFAAASATALVAACLKADAKTPAPRMAVPDPPSRLAIPVPVEAPEPIPTPTPTPAATDKPVTPTTSKPVTSKPPPTSNTSQETNPPPGAVLLPGAAAEVESRAKERLDRAEKDLRRVNRASLGNDAREQYDSADRFIRMAKDAITSRNFLFALSCADKAATLAALLAK